MEDRLRRVPLWGWALLFSVVLCLPRIGGYGFWDPWELKLAEHAREMSSTGQLFDPTLGGHSPAVKPFGPFLSALGISIFGAGELGARILNALSAVGALMAVYWAAAGLFRPRAALLSTLVLGSMTMFVLEARQLASDAPAMAGLALTLGGLGRYAWPASGRRRLTDLAVALVGMVIGFFDAGALTPIALPALSMLGALLIGYGLVATDLKAADGSSELAPGGVGRDVPAGRAIGSTARVMMAGLAVLAAVVLILSFTNLVAGKYSTMLGGTPRGGQAAHTFEFLVRQLGFGLFPWSAVAVFALARPLIRLDDAGEPAAALAPGEAPAPPRTSGRLAFGQLYLFVFAGLGFALSAYRVLRLGEGRYMALPAIALAIGVFLDEALEGNRSEPVAGLLIATGTLVVARDFFLEPAELVSVHLNDKVRWPPALSIGELVLAIGFLVGVGVYAGLAARGRALGKVAAANAGAAGGWRSRVQAATLQAGRWGLPAALGIAMAFALFVSLYLVPKLSVHLSFKPVLESYSKFAKPGEKIGRYHVEGQGSGFYGSQRMIDVPTQDRLIAFLRDGNRVFALVSADDLAALDTAFHMNQVPYYVVDASSSRFLLISNRLAPGESDNNPLKANVWMAPTPPLPGTDRWQPNEKPPWTWRVPVAAVFGDSIELIGADFPPTVRRPGKIPLDLYFRVIARPPGTYKIFVHFDGPAAPRVIGDHDPVNHVFPTSQWLPGEYIRDHYEVDVPLMTTPAGTYTVLLGFWPGGEGKRLKITRGPNDGADRVRIGTIEIK
jgi:hypothetical protein